LGASNATSSNRGSLHGQSLLGGVHAGDDLHGKTMLTRMGSSYLGGDHMGGAHMMGSTFSTTTPGSMAMHPHTLGTLGMGGAGMLGMSPPGAGGMPAIPMAVGPLGVVPGAVAGVWRAG
jgi:hypothetical protein